MPSSLRLGKIAGIDIYAHLSWFIILVLLTWSLAVVGLPSYFLAGPRRPIGLPPSSQPCSCLSVSLRTNWPMRSSPEPMG